MSLKQKIKPKVKLNHSSCVHEVIKILSHNRKFKQPVKYYSCLLIYVIFFLLSSFVKSKWPAKVCVVIHL